MSAVPCSLPLWGRAGVRALPRRSDSIPSAPIPTFPQRGKEKNHA
jgi:hypothetical protein